MRNKCYIFLLFTVLLQPCFSQSLSEQIETEAQKLELLQKNYEVVENKLAQSEQSLESAEKSLQIITMDFQALSKDYEKSQKKLKYLKVSLAVAIPISLVAGVFMGMKFNEECKRLQE